MELLRVYTRVCIVLFCLTLAAACGQARVEPTALPAGGDETPTAPPTDAAFRTPTPTVTPTEAAPTFEAPPTDLCGDYLGLLVLYKEAGQEAIPVSYRCHTAYIDATGRSPAQSPGLVVHPGVPLQLELAVQERPTAVEVRLYPGSGVAASFMRWPEELPTQVQPVDRSQPEPDTRFEYLVQAPPGPYSLNVKVAWGQEIEVFYAANLVLVEPEAAATTEPVATEWATYSDARFAVSLSYPSHWQLVPGSENRYEGEDGYFVLDAIGIVDSAGNPAAKLDEIVAQQIGHKLRPLGTRPDVESLQIQGQEARLIFPSADASMEGQAMLIAVYPKPIDLGETVQFFVLYADQEHIRALADTLRFHAASETVDAPRIVAFEVTPARAGPGDVVTLSWEARGARATLCPSARFVLFTPEDCRPVPLSGSTTL